MKKTFNKVWIPVLMVISGLIILSISGASLIRSAIGSIIDQPIISGEFSQKNIDLDNDTQVLSIRTDLVDKIFITFTDIEKPQLKALGEVNNLDVVNSAQSTWIKTANKPCSISFAKCNNPVYSSLDVTLPTSFAGSISLEGVINNISIQSTDMQQISRISIKSPSTNLSIHNIDATAQIDGANVTANMSNVSGSFRYNALNLVSTIENQTRDLTYRAESLSGDVTVRESTQSFGHVVKGSSLYGVYNDEIYNKDSHGLFNDFRISLLNDQLPTISISVDGLHQVINFTK